MENKYIIYKNDYNKLCNYRLNDVNLELDSSVDDYISSNSIMKGGLIGDTNDFMATVGYEIFTFILPIAKGFIVLIPILIIIIMILIVYIIYSKFK
jgi:hypothetical protein